MAAIDRIGGSDAYLLARGGATLGPVQVYDDGVAVGVSVQGEEWRGRAALFRDAYGNYFAHTATGNYPLHTDQRGTAEARTREWIKGHSISGLYDVRVSPQDPQIEQARSLIRASQKSAAETDPHHGHEHVLALQNALRDFDSGSSSDNDLQSAVRDAKNALHQPGALATDEATYLQDFIRQAEAKLVQAGAQGRATVEELGAATSNFDKNPGSVKARDRLNQALFDSEHAHKAKWLVDDVKQAALWEPSARKRLHPPRAKPVPPGLMGTPLSGTLITGTGIPVGAKSASGKYLQGDLVKIDGSQWGLRGRNKATPYKVPITIQDRDAAIAYCKKKIEGGGWTNLESLDPQAIKGSGGHDQAAYLKPLRDQVQVRVADIHDKEMRWGEITQSKSLLNRAGDQLFGDGFQLYQDTRNQLNDIVMEAGKGSINLEEAKRRVRVTMAEFSVAHERQISQFTSNAGGGAAIAGATQAVSNFIVTGVGNKFGGPGLGAGAGFANRTLQDFFADWVINASPLAKYYDKGVAQYVPKPGDPKRMAQNALASLADAVFLHGASGLTTGAAAKLAPLLPASWLAPVAGGLGFGGADLLRLPLDLLNTAIGQQFDQSALRQEIERAKTQYPAQKAEYLAGMAASWEQARPAWVQKQVRSEAVRFEAHKQNELKAERALRDGQLNTAMANAEHQLQGTPPAERAAALASLRDSLGQSRDALVAQRAAALEAQRQPFLDQVRAQANQRFDSARDLDLKQRGTQLDARQKASIKTAQARLTKLQADAPGELVHQTKEKVTNLVVTVPTGALFGATGNPLTQTGKYSFQLKPVPAAITTGIGAGSGAAGSVVQSAFSRGELPTVDEVINGALSGAITAIPLAGAVHGDSPAKPAPKSEPIPAPTVGAVEPPVLPSNPEPTPNRPAAPKAGEVLPNELKVDLQLQGTNAAPFTDYQFVLAGRKVVADTPAQAVRLQRRGARYVPFADRSKNVASVVQPEPAANLRADTEAWNSGLRTRGFVMEKAAAEPGGDPRAEPLRIEVSSPADVLAWRQAGWSYKGLGASRTASVDAGLLDSTLAQPGSRGAVLSLWETQGGRRGIVLSKAGRQVEVNSPAAALRLERSGWSLMGLGLPRSAADLSPLGSGAVTPQPAVAPQGAEAPTQGPGALVLANPAAIAVDIPAPLGKGRDRVGAVYTQVSPDLATVLARTLQDVNPNTYGQQPTADIVRDVVRLGEGDSLVVVVRDKNIAGQSPMSDTVATPETLLSAKEYRQLLDAKGPDAFAQAGSRIRLGAAKIYNAPPASAGIHIDAVKAFAGEGYGYLGQVIGANLQGSGGQAMKLTLDLARAANMKGVTLYTNAAAGFYEKLGFRTVAQTNNADGTVSNHMVWDNAAYRADQPTLRLDNPSVLTALNKPAATPDPAFGVPPVDRGPTAAAIGSASELPGVPFNRLKPSDLSFSVDGAVTRFELIKEATLGAIERKKQGIYDAGAVFWESKIEGPVIELGRSTRAKMQPSIDAAGLLVQEKILLPSARVLEEKVLAPVFESVPGQQLLSLIDTASQGFKSAAFEAKLQAIAFANTDAGLVLRDLATITRDAGLGAKDKVLNGLGKAGRQLQKSLPGVAGATLFVLGQAGARGTLRMVTVDVGAQPLVGEALMVKKALNIPNGIKFTYLIAEVPGMENVGGRAIVAYGGGDHALIQPATGPGQSGVSQPWIGQRSDGSVVLTATGIAQGPNAFFGYSLGTTNLNISDVYTAQLGRAAINPVSTSVGGEPRASGRNWDFKLGPFALDFATVGHQSVLNTGPLAMTFNRYRDPLSMKGGALSSENKNLVLQRRVGADGQVTYVPFIDITGKASVSDISPVVPITGSTTLDTQARDWKVAENLFKQLDGFVRDLPDAPAPKLPAEPFAPLAPRRPSDGSGPNSATNGDPPAGGSGGGGDVPPPNRPPGDLLDQAGVPQTLTPEQRDVARRNNLQMSLETPSSSSGAEPPLRRTRLEDLPRDRGFDPDTIVGMRAGDFAKEYLKIYNGFEANGTSHAADPALAARVYEVWKPEEALRLREIGARHDTPFEALVPFRVAAFDFARIEQLAQSGLVANNALRATEQGLERQMMSAGAYTVFNNVSLPGADGALAALSAALPRDAGGTLAARSTFGPGAGNTPAPDAVLDATAAALRQRFPRLYGSSSDTQIIERAQLRNNQITVSVSADNEVRFAVGTPRNVSVIPPGGGGLTTAQYEQALGEFAAALKRGNVTYRDNSIAEIVQGAELRSKTLFVLRDSTNPQAIATMTASLKEYGTITGLEGESFKQGTYAYLGQLTAGTGASAVPGAGTEQMSALQNVVRNSLARADVPDLQGIVLYTNNPANIKTYLDAGFSLTAVHQSAQSGKYEYYFRWAPGANTDLQEVPMVWVQSDHGGSEPPPTVGVPLRPTETAPATSELPVQTSTQGRTDAVLDFLDTHLPGHTQPARRAAQATLWNTADAVAVVVDAAGNVVAAARGSLRDDTFGRIDVVAVDAAARRQGLGRRLIESVEQQLRVQGAERIELRPADNTAAQRDELLGFYRQLGYAESVEHPGYLEKNLTGGREPLSSPRAGETTLEENIAAAGGVAGAEYKILSLFKDPASGLPNRLGQEFLMSFVDPATGQRRQMLASDLGLPEAKAALAKWGIGEPKVLDDGRVMTVDMKRLKELLANTAIAPNDANNVRVTTELARPERAGPQYTLGELWLATSWTQREFAVSHAPGSAEWDVLMGTGRLEDGRWTTAIPPKADLIVHFHPNGTKPSRADLLAAQSGAIGGRNSLVVTAEPGQKIDDVIVYVFGDVPGNKAHPGTRVKISVAPGAEVRSDPADGGGVPTDPALQARIARHATLLNPAGEPLTALPSGYQPGFPFALALEEGAGLPSRVWVPEQPAGTDAQAFKSLVGAAAGVPRATARRSLLLVNAQLDSSGQVQAARRDGASISHAQAQAIADATQRPVLTGGIVAAVMPRSWVSKVDATGYAPSDIRGARQAWSETVLRRLVKKFGAEATPQILDAVAQRSRFPNDSLTTARVDQFMQVMLPAANSHAQTQALDQLTVDAGLARGQAETDLLRSYLLNVGTQRWTEERWVQAMWMLTGENFSAIQTRLFDKLDRRLGLKSYDDVMRYYGRLVLDAATR